ncbi:type II toxin-antitoxin system HicA family toxin [Micromonospora zhanjiangensis]|uniref:Type II toxin-antitoxin system HicA family toxin n=1 Tax=Micromonospora zhanjiangensis TaxID=1522057 RepID=A0ABV8KPW3_9ACTN
MKRVDLLIRISKAAADAGVSFRLVREGGGHSVYRYGTQNVVIPRHREINELTARGILRSLGLG